MKPITIILSILLMMSLATATPLGIISNDYADYDGTIGGSVYQVTVRGDNDASYVVFGSQTALETSVEGETVTPQSTFTLTQSIESESCEYNLQIGGRNPIIQYNIDKIGNDIWFSRVDDLINSCKNEMGGIFAWGEWTNVGSVLFQDVYCLKEKDPLAKVGPVSEGKINFQSKFSLKKDSNPAIIKTISTLASNEEGIPTSIAFTDEGKTVGRIRWIGGSTFGEYCPGQDDYVAMQKSNGQWITADKTKFNEYNDQFVLLQELIDKSIIANDLDPNYEVEIRRLVDAVNSRGTAAMASKNILYDGGTSTVSGSKAIIQLPRDHLIYAPDFQIILSTDWLGIVYQTSKPEITDSGFNSCDESASSNSAYATIKNVGNKQATFNVGMACQEGLSLSTTTRSINLAPGASGTVTLPFSLELSADAKKSCTITVADSLNIDQEDRTSISTTCQATSFCSPTGKTECFGAIEKICQDGQWTETDSDACDTTICDRDSKCEAGLGETFEVCGGKLASDNDCATCNFDDHCDATENSYSCASDCGTIKEPISKVWLIIGGVVLAAAVFIGISSIKPKNKGRKGSRRKRK